MTIPAISVEPDVETSVRPSVADPISPDVRNCETCGVQLYYSGKGRPPRFCAEHKPSRSAGSKAKGKGSATAQQALQIIESMYSLASLGLTAVGCVGAASALLTGWEGVKNSTLESLKGAPKLCGYLCKIGEAGGAAAVVGWQASIIVPVIAIAREELAVRRESKAESVSPNIMG